MRSHTSRRWHLEALVWLPLALGQLGGVSGCATGNTAHEASTTANDSLLPPQSYFVETRMVALPPGQIGRLQTASTFDLDKTPGWTLYSGSGALVQLSNEATQLPIPGDNGPEGADGELLAYASRKLRLSLRDNTNQGAPPQLEVHLHSAPGIPPVERRGNVPGDGTPLVLDSGITYEGRILAVSIRIQKVTSREDMRCIYESKQAAGDVARQ